jgi:lambda family phage minor tail protein L
MEPISSAFKQEKNKAYNSPIYLYTLYDYDGNGNNFYFAEYDADVVYNGITYLKFPIKHDSTSENSTGRIDQVMLTVGNASRFLQYYLEAYDLRGKKVDIMIVFANHLNDTDANLVFTYFIDNYTANEESGQFILSSKFDVLDVSLPLCVYNRNYCRWVFKSTQCGYSGAQTACDKRRYTCKQVMNNVSRYGGFPSIPVQRVFL